MFLIERRNTLSTTEIVEKNTSLDDRLKRKNKFEVEYPEFVPVFVKHYDSDVIHRNILHRDIPFTKFLYLIRSKKQIPSTVGLMSLVEVQKEDNSISYIQVQSSMTIGELGSKYLHEDGFLYLNITIENIFG